MHLVMRWPVFLPRHVRRHDPKPRTPFRARIVAQAKATESARSLGHARAGPPLLPRSSHLS